MVPGSTLIYGSSLRKVMRAPRLSKRLPIDAEARPLPNDEITPPVTKMNCGMPALLSCSGGQEFVRLVVRHSVYRCAGIHASFPRPESESPLPRSATVQVARFPPMIRPEVRRI